MAVKGERRQDAYGEMRLMTEAEGYVMVRRKGAAPRIMSRKEWDSLRDPQAADKAQYEAYAWRGNA